MITGAGETGQLTLEESINTGRHRWRDNSQAMQFLSVALAVLASASLAGAQNSKTNIRILEYYIG